MNRTLKIIIIIVSALLLSAAILLLVQLLRPTEEAPEFVYTSASTSQSTTASDTQSTTASTTESTTASTTENTTVATTSQAPEEAKPVEAESVTVLTSNDPENYFELTFGEDTILLTGRYNAGEIGFARAGGASLTPVEYADDGTVTAEIKPYLVEATGILSIGNMSWVISMRGDGARFVICEEVMEQNIKAKEHILDIPEDIVADYIVTGGTAEQRTQVLSEISDIAAQVCEGIESDYDKARALSQWVSKNIYYDFDACMNSVTTETLSLGSTLSLHRSVCGGYANLYAALCQSQGIDCYIVQGDVVQGNRTFDNGNFDASHEWNMVYIDGRYFWVDALWNGAGNYIDGMYNDDTPNMRYFDPTEEAMSQNHRAVRIERREFY